VNDNNKSSRRIMDFKLERSRRERRLELQQLDGLVEDRSKDSRWSTGIESCGEGFQGNPRLLGCRSVTEYHHHHHHHHHHHLDAEYLKLPRYIPETILRSVIPVMYIRTTIDQ